MIYLAFILVPLVLLAWDVGIRRQFHRATGENQNRAFKVVRRWVKNLA